MELKKLDERLSFQYKFLSGYIFLAILLGGFFFFRLDLEGEHYLLIGTVLVFMLIGIWVFFQNYSSTKKQHQSIVFAKNNNSVTSIEVNAERYIELSEVEDEGVHYLFQLEGDRILSFGGQDFYPSKKFPSDNFEIAICYGFYGEIIFLKKYTSGKKLEPITKISGNKKWKLLTNANYPDPEKFSIVTGELDRFEEILAYT